LRLHWKEHFKTTFFRPVLFIDESQELPIYVLNELRLLTSAEFDSRLLLNVILAGDQRLNEKFRHPDLAPLGSRIRMRFNTVYAMPEELLLTLDHMVTTAGNPRLMTSGLMQTVCEHAMGNYRALAIMGGELLAKAAQLEQPILDEKLFFECYPQPTNSINKRKKN
jgi:type II secretory pathway predicted ATPase ExeA